MGGRGSLGAAGREGGFGLGPLFFSICSYLPSRYGVLAVLRDKKIFRGFDGILADNQMYIYNHISHAVQRDETNVRWESPPLPEIPSLFVFYLDLTR